MNILFLRFPYESVRGGAEHQTQWLATGLKERLHTVSLLGDCHPLASMFKEIGAETKKLSIGLPPVTLWLAMSFLWRRKTMKQKLIKAIESMPHQPDVLVMLSLTEKILLTEWATKKGMKVLWVEHDRIGRWLIKNPWLQALIRASRFATIVCVSEMSQNKMIALGFDKKNIVAIPNGIPFPPSPDPFPQRGQGSSAQSFWSGELKVGVIARLSPEKGIDVLLRAIADLPEITLTIVGTGREEGYLRSLIFEDAQRIGIQRITLVPRMVDLEKFYQSLDILVLPSLDHDPFGLVAAEAMAHSVATVITDACGIASYVEHGKDVLIAKAGSSESLESAIRSLLDETFRAKIAEEGKITARMCFSLPMMADAYEQVMKRTT